MGFYQLSVFVYVRAHLCVRASMYACVHVFAHIFILLINLRLHNDCTVRDYMRLFLTYSGFDLFKLIFPDVSQADPWTDRRMDR